MKRPLAYITAHWGDCTEDNMKLAAKYCRAVYDAGYQPICPMMMHSLFLREAIPQEHKDGLDMSKDYLYRSALLVVCGNAVDETMKNDIAMAARFHKPATTLDGAGPEVPEWQLKPLPSSWRKPVSVPVPRITKGMTTWT